MSDSLAYNFSEELKPVAYGNEPYIFVSYAHDDKSIVYRHIFAMQKEGFRVWYDEDIRAESYKAKIVKKIKGSALFLIFISPNSAGSLDCRQELGIAFRQKIDLQPVYLCDTALSEEFEYDLENTNPIFRSDYNNEKSLYEKLFKLLPPEAKGKNSSNSPVQPVPFAPVEAAKKPRPSVRRPAPVSGQTDYSFGAFEWQVLEVDEENKRALLITKNIIEQRCYNEGEDTTNWRDCTLSAYLNGEFLKNEDNFLERERKQILLTEVENKSNPWFGTPGIRATEDYVFLLSIEEVFKKLSGTNVPQRKKKEDWYWSDENSGKRIANYVGEGSWWWLRSPGARPDDVASVGSGGYVDLTGGTAHNPGGGVRPALWLNLES